MALQTTPPAAIRSESRWIPGASCNAWPGETQQQCKSQFIHQDAAVVVTENMTQNPHLKQVRKTSRDKSKTQDVVGFELLHVDVDGG
jgi:hypothetical protein